MHCRYHVYAFYATVAPQQAFGFREVRDCVRACVIAISYKLTVGISWNL